MNNIHNWLAKNGFNNIDLTTSLDFAYNITNNTIVIGTEKYPTVGRYFEQFLYEYGLEYSGIFDSVLAFLHELGHVYTIPAFSNAELMLYQIAKNFTAEDFTNMETEQEKFNYYWELPDEFAANMWVINFVNNNIEAVEELCNIWMKVSI